METLTKDVSTLILLNKELSPRDFINLCASESSPKITQLCNDENIWKQRLLIDFPYLNYKSNYKNNYLKVVRAISKSAENIKDYIINQQLGKEFEKNLKDEYLRELFDRYFKLINTIVADVFNTINEEKKKMKWAKKKKIIDETLRFSSISKFLIYPYDEFPMILKHINEEIATRIRPIFYEI